MVVENLLVPLLADPALDSVYPIRAFLDFVMTQDA